METELELQVEQSRTFFDRDVASVAKSIADKVLIGKHGETQQKGIERLLYVGDKVYRITEVQAYDEQSPTRPWSGIRKEAIGEMPPGHTVTYQYRSGRLTYIKTSQGNNIWIKELALLDPATGQSRTRSKSPTQVTELLGLNIGDEGRILLRPDGALSFERLLQPRAPKLANHS